MADLTGWESILDTAMESAVTQMSVLMITVSLAAALLLTAAWALAGILKQAR